MNDFLYIFLDEGGNFDFSPNGTKYFSLSCTTTSRPFLINQTLEDYQYDCIEFGLEQEYFHCSEDNKYVRTKVFNIIADGKADFRVDSILVNKQKTHPALRGEKKFYPEMLGYLLEYVFKREYNANLKEIIIITDSIPLNKKRHAIEKAVKGSLSKKLPKSCIYRIFHHNSRSHFGLQIADYFNWAIWRKWEKSETEYYRTIKKFIKSEFDIFKSGNKLFY